MNALIEAIGFVETVCPHAEDDFTGGEEARIALAEGFMPEALRLSNFFSVNRG
ncbi:MAG: hypothetical protein AB1761_12870 [Pseudomonadota bacterium]